MPKVIKHTDSMLLGSIHVCLYLLILTSSLNALNIDGITITHSLVAAFTFLAVCYVILNANSIIATLQKPGFFRLYLLSASLFITTIVIHFYLGNRDHIYDFYKLFYAVYIFPLLISIFVSSNNLLDKLTYFYVTGVIVNVIFAMAIYYQIVPNEVLSHTYQIKYWGRISSLSTHPNHLSLFSLCAFSIVCYRYFTSDNIIIWLIGLAILYFGIVVGGSRANLLSILILLSILSILYVTGRCVLNHYSFRILLLILLLSVISLGFYFDSSWNNAVLRVLGYDPSSSASNASHMHLTTESIIGFLSSPVYGAGPDYLFHAHNIYLQILHSGGILLFSGTVIFFIYLAKLHINYRNQVVGYHYPLLPLFLVIFLWLVNGILSNQLTNIFLYIPFGFIFSIYIHSLYRSKAP